MNNKTDDFIKSHYENRPLDWMFENRFTIKQMLEEFSGQQNKAFITENEKLINENNNQGFMILDLQSELSRQKELVEEAQSESESYFNELGEYKAKVIDLKQEIEGLKEESAHYKKMYINELDAYPALKKLNQSQSLRIKELEEGLRSIGMTPSVSSIWDKVKSLLSTPTTEPKEEKEGKLKCNCQYNLEFCNCK